MYKLTYREQASLCLKLFLSLYSCTPQDHRTHQVQVGGGLGLWAKATCGHAGHSPSEAVPMQFLR